jgi:hypothetical protein
MADRYWVGGAASWDATALLKWSTTSGGVGGAAVPTAVDDVYFNAASGAVTVTVAAAATCKNLTFTGFTGTFAGSSALTISGSLTLVSAMTRTFTGVVTFDGTSANTITSNTKDLNSNVTFNGVSGSWQLADNFVTGSTRTVTLTNGTLDINGKTLTGGAFSSSNSNTRTVAFGTGGKFIATRDNIAIWNTSTSTGLTVTGDALVEATYSGAVGTRSFNGGATSETNSVSLSVSAGTDSFTAQNNIRNLNLTGFAGTLTNSTRSVFGNLTVSSGVTLTAGALVTTFAATSSKTITTNGKTLDFPLTFNGIGGTFAFQDALTQGSTRAFTITEGTVQLKSGATSTAGSFVANSTSVKYLQSTTPGSQATISQASGTVTVSDLTIQDSNAAGGASWNAYADFGNEDAGNNDGWNFGLSPPFAAYEPPIIIRSFTQPRRF